MPMTKKSSAQARLSTTLSIWSVSVVLKTLEITKKREKKRRKSDSRKIYANLATYFIPKHILVPLPKANK